MMKKLLIAIMIMMPLAVNAQRVDKPGEPYDFFCNIDFNTLKSEAYLSWNNEKKSLQLYDENGKKIEFPNAASVINYMAKRGWILFVVYSSHTDVMYFKKTVTNDEQAKEGLYFKEDFKKK